MKAAAKGKTTTSKVTTIKPNQTMKTTTEKTESKKSATELEKRNYAMEIITEFDKLPAKTNKIGSWIVFGATMLIIFNLILSFCQVFGK